MQQALIFFKTQPITLSIQRRTNIERALIIYQLKHSIKPSRLWTTVEADPVPMLVPTSNGLKSNTQFYSKHRNSHWSRNLQWLTPARFIDPIWLTGFPNIRKYKYFDRKTFPSWIILDSVSSLQEVIPLHRSRMCTLQADYKSMIKHDPVGKLAKWLYGFSVASTDSRH